MNNWAEFRHFRYLLAIVEHKGFRAAAEHLHTAEPNLSVQARQFQEAFAIQLFKKGKNGRIELTETGVAFKAIAQGVLDARDEALAALIAIERGQVRTLNLGCAPFVDPEVFRTACEIHKEVVPSCPIRPTHPESKHRIPLMVFGFEVLSQRSWEISSAEGSLSQQFTTTLECSYTPVTGHRPLFNLFSSDGRRRFRVPFGSGAYTHIAYLIGGNWPSAWNAAVLEPGTAHHLREIELNDVDLWYLSRFFAQ